MVWYIPVILDSVNGQLSCQGSNVVFVVFMCDVTTVRSIVFLLDSHLPPDISNIMCLP